MRQIPQNVCKADKKLQIVWLLKYSLLVGWHFSHTWTVFDAASKLIKPIGRSARRLGQLPSASLFGLVSKLPSTAGVRAIIPVVHTVNILLFHWNKSPLNAVSLWERPVHLLLSTASLCANAFQREITGVSKRARAAAPHRPPVFQAHFISVDESMQNADWGDMWPLDSAHSYTQRDAHTHTHTHKHGHACTHSGWRRHWFEEDTPAVIIECFTCYLKCILRSGAHTHTHTHTHKQMHNQRMRTASRSLLLPFVSDTWCTYGTTGATCPSRQTVTRPTPNWSSSSWIARGRGRR